MIDPRTKSVLTAGAIALAVTMIRLAPAARTAAATDAPSPDHASAASGWRADEALSLGARASLAGVRVAPHDDGSDSGDGDDGDDSGDEDDGREG